MFSKMNSKLELNKVGDLPPSPGERVFRSWELVMNIFSYLPWSEVCRLRNLSAETRYACQYSVREIIDPEAHNIQGKLYCILCCSIIEHCSIFFHDTFLKILIPNNSFSWKSLSMNKWTAWFSERSIWLTFWLKQPPWKREGWASVSPLLSKGTIFPFEV